VRPTHQVTPVAFPSDNPRQRFPKENHERVSLRRLGITGFSPFVKGLNIQKYFKKRLTSTFFRAVIYIWLRHNQRKKGLLKMNEETKKRLTKIKKILKEILEITALMFGLGAAIKELFS
jgi:hypothetical protein